MQVQRLAVRIAPGGAPDLDELLDLRMAHRQIDRRRATPQRALRDRQGQAVGIITRMNGITPEVLPTAPTFSPIERRLPQ